MKTMKVRDLLRRMAELGATAHRISGSHQTWILPSGSHVIVVVNHKNDDVTPLVYSKAKRAFRDAGFSL